MKRATRAKKKPDLRRLPFSELIVRDDRLAELRQSYARRTAAVRRGAADWAYHESAAKDLFHRALAQAGQESSFLEDWPPGIEALAIDPAFAPALLTVGSMEHQLGRRNEARALLRTLLKLAKDTPELEAIIDKAGTFLLDADDVDEAYAIYEAACAVFPGSPRLLGGVAHSLAKLGRHAEAVSTYRRALALDPSNPELLNDLGWALTENGQYQEAERVLQQAAALAPPEYDLPRNNLKEVRRLEKSRKPQ